MLDSIKRLLLSNNSGARQLGIELAIVNKISNWDILELVVCNLPYASNYFWVNQQDLKLKTRIIITTDIDACEANQLGSCITLRNTITSLDVTLYFHKQNGGYSAEIQDKKHQFDNLHSLMSKFNKLKIF
jgi:hypothetical protein